MTIAVKTMRFSVENHHDNIVVKTMLEQLFDNFDHIPHEELQALIDKHRVV